MKTSIKKLLSSVQFNAMLLMLITVATGLILASSLATYDRINNMALQEQMVKEIAKKDRKDVELDRIQVNGILNRLPILIDRMQGEAPYEIVNSLIIREAARRSTYADVLRERYKRLSETATAYFDAEKNLNGKRKDMLIAIDAYTFALYPVTKLQNAVLYQYALLTGIGLGLILLWSFVVIFVSRHVSKTILDDIHALFPEEGSKRSSEYKTYEINSIALKLHQGSGSAALAPSKKDEVTQLPNYEGIKASFEHRPSTSKNLQTFVCIFEIDNYSKLVNHFPQSVIDPILIKITSIMKLHKMQNDLIGRIQGGQFIAVFVRADKQKAMDDCDHIRQMIEENRFKMPHDSFPITLSGGFTSKTATHTLDDSVKNATERLRVAQKKGGNVIS
jgi:diguanylate cyclase (GGDEF)-like protein